MINCPLCSELVAQLKTNSHILPRWMIKAIKKNGQLIQANVRAGTADLTQKDMKADIVCDTCESLFTQCDTFADHFFKYEHYKDKSLMRTGPNGKVQLFAVHKAEAKEGLIRFVVSALIRMHLFQVLDGDNTLQTYFDRVRAAFLANNLSSLNLKILICQHMALQKFHIFPAVSREEPDAVDVLIFGQRIHLFFGSVPSYFEYIVNQPKIEVMQISGKATQLYADLHTFAKRTQS